MQEQNYTQQKIKLSTWKTILSQAGHHANLFAIILSCGMALGIARLMESLLNMYIIDHFVEPGQLHGFGVAAAVVLFVHMLYACLLYTSRCV